MGNSFEVLVHTRFCSNMSNNLSSTNTLIPLREAPYKWLPVKYLGACNNKIMAGRIFITFGVDVMPFHDNTKLYFLVSYKW
jgi:hypothetical protein